MSYFTMAEAASLDNWITGNYGEDHLLSDSSPVCWNCGYFYGEEQPEDGGTCVCKNSPKYWVDVDFDDGCSLFSDKSS